MAPENTLNPQAGRPRGAAQAALGIAVCAALCGIDLAALACAPARAQAAVSNVAVPFDLMVCVPAAFYLLVVRPRKLTPLIALPVIYTGGLISAQIAQPDAFSLIGPLLLAAGAVDVLVAAREGARLARSETCVEQAVRAVRANVPRTRPQRARGPAPCRRAFRLVVPAALMADRARRPGRISRVHLP